MQGSDNNVITHTATVKTCIVKLELWHGRVQAITMQFVRYSELKNISEQFENLIDAFSRDFPDVVNEGTLLIRNPFRWEVKDVQLDICRENLLS